MATICLTLSSLRYAMWVHRYAMCVHRYAMCIHRYAMCVLCIHIESIHPLFVCNSLFALYMHI